MKTCLFPLILLLAGTAAFGQTSLEEYRTEVASYSRTLKIARAGSRAAEAEAAAARTGYLPQLSLAGNFSWAFRCREGAEQWTFGVLPQLVQTLYGGGAVRAAARQTALGSLSLIHI